MQLLHPNSKADWTEQWEEDN